jgi:SAM-dependent methyltransferase
MTGIDPDEYIRRLRARGPSGEGPTDWFEPLYAGAVEGETVVPWDRGAPHPLLVQWAEARALSGRGQRAIVVGSGLGEDAEYVARLGFDTVAFDIAETAVRTARQRFPGSPVAYETADLLARPAAWREAFDLVVESYTVQALPDPPRRQAIAAVAQMVRPGGTLIVIAMGRDDDEDPGTAPPWRLTRAEIDAFATAPLRSVRVEDVRDAERPGMRWWRAELVRPATSA